MSPRTEVAPTAEGERGSLIWDWPTRLVHWLFVLLIAAAYATEKTRHMDWHRWCGYALLALLVFRFYWGVFGFSPSRFSSFVRGPRATLAYLRRLPDRRAAATPGHNPLGALSVILLLALMLIEVGLGLFTVDVDGIESGPLSDWVSFDVGRACAEAHHFLFYALLALIVLHLAAIAFYAVYKRENLIGPMLHGKKPVETAYPPLKFALPRLFGGVVLSLALTVLVVRAFKI